MLFGAGEISCKKCGSDRLHASDEEQSTVLIEYLFVLFKYYGKNIDKALKNHFKEPFYIWCGNCRNLFDVHQASENLKIQEEEE